MVDLRSRRWRYWAWGIGTVVIVTAILLAFLLGPWRQAYLDQRRLTEQQQAIPPMSQFVPDTVTGRQDIAYGSDERETLDVWFPRDLAAREALPAIVWVHGGGWIGGSKADIAPYIQILAGKGFTTIGVNYSLAPDQEFPRQIQQLNAALGYVTQHAEELHVDPSQIVLAGDSGGAHIAAKLAAGVTDSTAAEALDLMPAVQPEQLAGLILACGAFDLGALVDDVGGVVKDYVEAYVGTTSLKRRLARASVDDGVTRAFPPTWLSGGNADPLTPQVKEFASTLTSRGVDVETMFWAKDHAPPLGHEYQFNLGLAESVKTLESAVAFAQKHTSPAGAVR
ncbi:alpha/beta hydrolase fold domain-containing protein [Aeromicrobium sp. P5_D10]